MVSITAPELISDVKPVSRGVSATRRVDKLGSHAEIASIEAQSLIGFPSNTRVVTDVSGDSSGVGGLMLEILFSERKSDCRLRMLLLYLELPELQLTYLDIEAKRCANGLQSAIRFPSRVSVLRLGDVCTSPSESVFWRKEISLCPSSRCCNEGNAVAMRRPYTPVKRNVMTESDLTCSQLVRVRPSNSSVTDLQRSVNGADNGWRML